MAANCAQLIVKPSGDFASRAADHVDLRRDGEEVPAVLQDVDQAFAVVGMQVGEEDRLDRAGGKAELGPALVGAAPGVELHDHVAAIVRFVAVAHQRARPRLPCVSARPALSAGDDHLEAGRGARLPSGARKGQNPERRKDWIAS